MKKNCKEEVSGSTTGGESTVPVGLGERFTVPWGVRLSEEGGVTPEVGKPKKSRELYIKEGDLE